MEEVDSADSMNSNQLNDMLDVEISDQTLPVEEDEILLLNNVDEVSELTKNM